jgi:hypothetical protein
MLLEQAVEIIVLVAENDLVVRLSSELSTVTFNGISAVRLVLVTILNCLEDSLEGSTLLSSENVEDEEHKEHGEVSSEHSLSDSGLLLLGGSHSSFALGQNKGRDDHGQEAHIPDMVEQLDLNSIHGWRCYVGHCEVGEVLIAPWNLVLLLNESCLASGISHFISTTEDANDTKDKEDP